MTFEHSLNALLNDRLILKFTGPELGFLDLTWNLVGS